MFNKCTRAAVPYQCIKLFNSVFFFMEHLCAVNFLVHTCLKCSVCSSNNLPATNSSFKSAIETFDFCIKKCRKIGIEVAAGDVFHTKIPTKVGK